MSSRLALMATVLIVCFAVNATQASVPTSMHIQGRLTDSVGTPLSPGFKQFTFSVFDAEIGGIQLWTEAPQFISSDAGGLWNAVIGESTALSASVFADTARWLEIAVDDGLGGGAVTLPRVRLRTGPYAFQAQQAMISMNADTATHATHATYADTADYALVSLGDDDWTVTDSLLYTTDFLGIVRGGAGNSYGGDSGHTTINFGVACTTNGYYSAIGGGYGNIASGNGSVIAGGQLIGATSSWCTVGGGYANSAASLWATVCGGNQDNALGIASFVGGGSNNLASGTGATVAGGTQCKARGDWSVIAGGGGQLAGDSNSASGDYATIGGGRAIVASGDSATVAGGAGNSASGSASTVGGGRRNVASDDNATVGGGRGNVASGSESVISGGATNSATRELSVVGGGVGNNADGARATIGGGEFNTAEGNNSTIAGGVSGVASGTYSTIGGGIFCRASGDYSVVCGGGGGIGDSNTASGHYSAIGGGRGNHATTDYCTIAGGYSNTAGGAYATAPGGYDNSANGSYSFAAGKRAVAANTGAFVWADASTSNTFSSAGIYGDNSFSVRATGGVFIATDYGVILPYAGASLPPGATAWTPVSDSAAKMNVRPVDGSEILDRIAELPINRWNYKHQADNPIDHIGPMAQDFYRLFQVGHDNKTISTLDPDGIALAAIKELSVRNAELEERVAELTRLVERLVRE